ncbi:MAG: hypothetical protein KDI92_04805 [Xanthomonadales bacterium]|nr:hypothetical protein [Xanthomonadales bacterium]
MKPKITIKDKNVMTLTLALLTLSLIILGVSFSHQKNKPEVIHSMDIILSKKSNPQTPEDAEYLAQNNQMGGGTLDKKARPTDPFSATSPVAEGLSSQESHKRVKQQQKQQETQIITTQQSQQLVRVNQPNKDKKNQSADDQEQAKEQKLAQIKDELAKKIENYAKKPRSKYVSSATKAYEFAPYINNWVKKIERTGDLN